MVVLRCDNSVLYPRLEKRGYSEKKVQENVECEIMCVVAEDARESYRSEVCVHHKCKRHCCCIVTRGIPRRFLCLGAR